MKRHEAMDRAAAIVPKIVSGHAGTEPALRAQRLIAIAILRAYKRGVKDTEAEGACAGCVSMCDHRAEEGTAGT